jgi:gamma-glutamyltranspeptidase/glutathione hydrolase
MPVPSSGGIAVGESLNLIEAYQSRTGTPLSAVDEVQYLHRFAEATATAFADRNRWVGDVRRVPTRDLLSQGFADERACQLFDPMKAAPDLSRSASRTAGIRPRTAGCRPLRRWPSPRNTARRTSR